MDLSWHHETISTVSIVAVLLVMNENQKKSVDLAIDVTKHFMALAWGLAGFTITFSKDLIGLEKGKQNFGILFWVWGSASLSVFFGTMVLQSIIGHLANSPDDQIQASIIYQGNVKFLSILQILMLFVTLGFLVVFVIKSS